MTVLELSSTPFLAGSLLLTLAITLRFLAANKQKLPLGPRGLPWIGQALDIPMYHSHLYYTKLRDTYGDVYSLTALGQKFIILNSYSAAFDMLAKHGATYCNRPGNPYLRHFLGHTDAPSVIDAGPDWKEARRLYQTLLNKDTSRANYAELIASQLRQYILRVIELKSDTKNKRLDITIHKVFLESMYGITVKDDDLLLLNAMTATEIASFSLLPTKHMINIFPKLQYLPAWIPFQNWRIEAAKERELIDFTQDVPWQQALDAEASGTAAESFALGLLRERTPANEHLLKVTAVTNILAGIETVDGVSRTFLLAMLLYPDIQRKAQEEIDRVIGHDRLPSIDDQPNLPYLDAIVKEVIRWRPVAPIGVPTTPTRPSKYGEYHIFEDVIVVQNSWGISRDERIYPDAESFNPDRWLVPHPPTDSRSWIFGIGRRVCPGMSYAEVVYTTLFMTLLATVDIVHAIDQDGKEVYVDPAVPTTGRVISIPQDFSYQLRPRSESAHSLLHEAALAA
ncbi:cytochrome P450 [Clavulina sp. PMI_390]|nr:cytochrome P450 [Clavulina sp. PMI_390]